MLALVVLGRRLLVEEGVLRQLLLKVHGVDGRLRGAQQPITHEVTLNRKCNNTSTVE